MADNLPVKSERREIVHQHREIARVNARPKKHLRHYDSGKVTIVNPEVQPKNRIIVLPRREVQAASSGFISRIQLPPRKNVEENVRTTSQTARAHFETIMADLFEFYTKMENANERQDDNAKLAAQNELNEYANNIGFVNGDNGTDFYEWDITGGGPSEQFRIYADGHVDFIYFNWGTSIKEGTISLNAEDANIVKSLVEFEAREEERKLHEELDEPRRRR